MNLSLIRKLKWWSCFVIASIFLNSMADGTSLNFKIETVEGGSGGASSMAWDQYDDEPAIAYSVGGALRYAKRNNGIWTIASIDSVIGAPNMISLAFDPASKRPGIAYSTGALKFAAFTGTDWSIQMIDRHTGDLPPGVSEVIDRRGVSLGYDPQTQKPRISYLAYMPDVNCILISVSYDGTNWSTSTPSYIVSGSAKQTSVVFDTVSSLPAIAFDRDAPFLVAIPPAVYNATVAQWTGSSWTTSTIQGNNICSEQSLAIDPKDHMPAAGVIDHYTLNIRYAKFDGTNWSVTEIDSGTECAMDFNPISRLAAIAYCSSSNLKLAMFNGSRWNIQQIDTGGCASPSIEFRSKDGTAGISYRGAGNALKYVQAVFMSPAAEKGDVKIQGGRNGYVNPAKGETARIWIKPTGPGRIVVRIFTSNGQLLQTLEKDVIGSQPALIEWAVKNSQASVIASGVYLVSVEGPGIRETKKLVVIK